jgi:2-keto-3-deoxy-L-rhamnonate aldolase RhmA
MDHPEVKEALARAKDIVLASGKYLAVPCLDGDTARKAIAAGAHIINIGCHRLFISAAREYLTKARAGG